MKRALGLWWALAPEDAVLDPERYLGELNELPDPLVPGLWCDVTVKDREGTLRWRLVVVEPGREASIFEERRGGSARRAVRAVGTGDPLDGGRVTGPAAADR